MTNEPLTKKPLPPATFSSATDLKIFQNKFAANLDGRRAFYAAMLGAEDVGLVTDIETQNGLVKPWMCRVEPRGKATIPPLNMPFGTYRMHLALNHLMGTSGTELPLDSLMANVGAAKRDVDVCIASKTHISLQNRTTEFFVALNAANLILANDSAAAITMRNDNRVTCIYGYPGMHATFVYDIAAVARQVLEPLAALINHRDTNNLYWRDALACTLSDSWVRHEAFRAACNIHFTRNGGSVTDNGMMVGLPSPTMIMAYGDGGACVFLNDVTREIRLTAAGVVRIAIAYLETLYGAVNAKYAALEDGRISYLNDMCALKKMCAAWKAIPDTDKRLDADFRAAIDAAQRALEQKKREELSERDKLDDEFTRIMGLEEELEDFLRKLKTVPATADKASEWGPPQVDLSRSGPVKVRNNASQPTGTKKTKAPSTVESTIRKSKRQ